MKITIGTTSYNRLSILRQTITSLRECESWQNHNLRIYDDTSPLFTESDLLKLFPEAKEIRRRGSNLGADGNMYQMFVDFLDTSDDVLLIADSDLLFAPQIFHVIEEWMPLTDGIFSCYNSVRHKVAGTEVIKGLEFVKKLSLGAAGTAMTKETVQDIIKNVPPSKTYDWDWCRFLTGKGKRLLCTNQSYIQHIGLEGQNHRFNSIADFGLNFYPGTPTNEKILVEFFQTLVIHKDDFIENSWSPKILARKFFSLIKILTR